MKTLGALAELGTAIAVTMAVLAPVGCAYPPRPRLSEITPSRPPVATIHRLSVVVDNRKFREHYREMVAGYRDTAEHARLNADLLRQTEQRAHATEEEYSQAFVDAITAALGSPTIEVLARSYSHTLAHAESGPIDAASFSPDAKLLLTLTTVHPTKGLFSIGDFRALEYEVSVRESHTNALLWHAQAHVRMGGGSRDSTKHSRQRYMTNLALTIAEALKEAKVI